MNTVIDLFNNILKYGTDNIYVVIDNHGTPWFSGADCARLLKYNDTDQAIRTHVNIDDKTSIDKLKQFMKYKIPYTKPNSIYINESGLYSLLLSSRKEQAEPFKRWILKEVIPRIRKTGEYKVESKYKKKLIQLEKKLKEKSKRVRILEHNQKKKKYKVTGLIYVLRSINHGSDGLIKMGRTTDLNKRLNTYNTSVPDDMELLFVLEVDDPISVEHCIKGLASQFIYRKNKEYYRCTLKKFKKIIIQCDKLVRGEQYCDSCQSRVNSFSHFYDDHNMTDDAVLYLDLVIDQTGGTRIPDETFLDIPIMYSDRIKEHCQNNFLPIYDYHNTPSYICKIDQIKKTFADCDESCDDEFITQLKNENNLSNSDTILIYIDSDQYNEPRPTNHERFSAFLDSWCDFYEQ